MITKQTGTFVGEEVNSPPGHRRADDELCLLDRSYSARTLTKALARKVRRKLFGLPQEIEPAFRFGYLIFDRSDLNGGGSGFGQDYIRVLTEVGLDECGRLFEFRAGPEYIGYSLLARGFCRHLTLADVNPVAVQAAQRNTDFNSIAHRVTVYSPDDLDQIPANEKWDLVVADSPHFLEWNGELRCEDTDWQLHKMFYSQVKRFLNPGAWVILQENAFGSSAEVFIPMIREAEGNHIQTLPGPDMGAGGKMYLSFESIGLRARSIAQHWECLRSYRTLVLKAKRTQIVGHGGLDARVNRALRLPEGFRRLWILFEMHSEPNLFLGFLKWVKGDPILVHLGATRCEAHLCL